MYASQNTGLIGKKPEGLLSTLNGILITLSSYSVSFYDFAERSSLVLLISALLCCEANVYGRLQSPRISFRWNMIFNPIPKICSRSKERLSSTLYKEKKHFISSKYIINGCVI